MQADVVISAGGIRKTVTFEAGPGAPDNITVYFNITDDNVALEAVEMFEVELSLPQQNPSVVQLGDISVTTVTILDDDGMNLYNHVCK